MPKKLIGVFLGWILIAGVSTALAQKPLMQAQVDTLIAGGAKTQQVIRLIQARGIGFTLSGEYLESLQLKGVDKRVIAALCVAATGPLSKDQLIVLLKSETPDKSLAELVEKRHLSFKPSDDDLAQFFGMGAGDQLDIALQNSKLVVATLANGKLEPKPAGAAPPGAFQDAGGHQVTPPVLLKHPAPRYTKEALQARIFGVVHLRIVVNDQGEVTDAKVTKGLGYGLDESALRAVKSWKFNPARRDGTPFTAAVEIEVNFALDPQHYPGID